VTLRSDRFARAVYLSVADHDGSFSDNYFDLVPGKPMVVEYRQGTTLSLRAFRERIRVRSMVDAF
jgi:beta-mannosidase